MANHSEVDAHCKVNMKTEVGEVAEVEEAGETAIPGKIINVS